MRIAVDTHVSINAIEALKNTGFDVVTIAGIGEDDESWVSRALSAGAEVFVSSDLDIPNLLERYDSMAIWLDLPQGKVNLYNWIVQSIKRMEERLEKR